MPPFFTTRRQFVRTYVGALRAVLFFSEQLCLLQSNINRKVRKDLELVQFQLVIYVNSKRSFE